MDDPILALTAAALVGLLATLVIVRRQRRDAQPVETPFAASSEGETRCPKCGMGNGWTDRTCISCGARLPG